MVPSQHELKSRHQVVNLDRYQVVNLNRFRVVNLNRRQVVSLIRCVVVNLTEFSMSIMEERINAKIARSGFRQMILTRFTIHN